MENGKFKEGKIREIYLQYDSICKNIDRFDGNFSKSVMSESLQFLYSVVRTTRTVRSITSSIGYNTIEIHALCFHFQRAHAPYFVRIEEEYTCR